MADAGLRRGGVRGRGPRPAPGRDRAVHLVVLPGRAFDNDTGWRIDYHVATAGLAGRAVKAWVERAATHAERWSDHAPVSVVYEQG